MACSWGVISVAQGEVLCFLDQDLVPEPGYVERMVTTGRGYSLASALEAASRTWAWA